jgi:organic hydroperoxide reductase OsmC/OhrA
MQSYPHTYHATARGSAAGPVPVQSPGLPSLSTAPPKEFDGPGDVWSPETLLVAAIAVCYILTFRGVARAAKFEWDGLQCEVEGVLERVDGVTRFTGYTNRATVTVKPGADHGKAKELLERTERVCLVNNSILGKRQLLASVMES